VEKSEKLGQLQFSLFISSLQNPNFAWRSCSNRREKHRTTSTNVVEGCLIYNFRIYHFCRTVQIFGETRSQSRVDQLKTGRSRSRAPTARRASCRLGCVARRAQATTPPRRPCWPDSHRLEVRATRSPSRRHPGNTCHIFYRAVPAPSVLRSVARATAERVHRGLSPYYGVTPSSYFDA
jgi:hypothetical protein